MLGCKDRGDANEAEDRWVDDLEVNRGRPLTPRLLCVPRVDPVRVGFEAIEAPAKLALDFLRTGLVSLELESKPSTITQLLRISEKPGWTFEFCMVGVSRLSSRRARRMEG